jgi:hypothetical protein
MDLYADGFSLQGALSLSSHNGKLSKRVGDQIYSVSGSCSSLAEPSENSEATKPCDS